MEGLLGKMDHTVDTKARKYEVVALETAVQTTLDMNQMGALESVDPTPLHPSQQLLFLFVASTHCSGYARNDRLRWQPENPGQKTSITIFGSPHEKTQPGNWVGAFLLWKGRRYGQGKQLTRT